MSETEKRVPELRFKGFVEDWEQRKLETLVDRIKSYSLSREVESVEYTGYKYIHYGDIHTKVANIIEESSTLPNIRVGNYDLLNKGDLVLADASEDYQGIAMPAIVTMSPSYNLVAGLHTIALRPIFADSMFLYYLIHSPIFRKYGYKIGTGMKVFGISVTNILKFESKFPSVNEQKKIGKLLKKMDETIALHQQQLNEHQKLKKILLQKLFPQEGQLIPELRFSGFIKEWELSKLGDLSEIVRGASPRPIQDPKWFDSKSDIGWLRISDVTEQNGRIYFLEQKISTAGQEKTRVLHKPHLLLSIAATVGKPVVNYVKTGVHDGFLIFLNPIFDQEYMFQWLEMFKPKWHKYGQPGSQVNLNSELVRNQEILMPTIEEQKKIGSFLKQLDHTIALHNEKIGKMQSIKNVLLKKIFI